MEGVVGHAPSYLGVFEQVIGRVGRPRKYYTLQPEGARALHETFTAIQTMAGGVVSKLRRLAEENRLVRSFRDVVEAEHPGHPPRSAAIAPEMHELRNGIRLSPVLDEAMLAYLDRAELSDRIDAEAPLNQYSTHTIVPGATL